MGIERTGHLNPPSLGGRELEGGLAPSPRPSPSRGEGVSDDEGVLAAAFKALLPAASLFVPMLFARFISDRVSTDNRVILRGAIPKATERYAASLHEEWRTQRKVVDIDTNGKRTYKPEWVSVESKDPTIRGTEIDIANIPFERLPEELKHTYVERAANAMQIISANAKGLLERDILEISLSLKGVVETVRRDRGKDGRGEVEYVTRPVPYAEQSQKMADIIGAADHLNEVLAEGASAVRVVLTRTMENKKYTVVPGRAETPMAEELKDVASMQAGKVYTFETGNKLYNGHAFKDGDGRLYLVAGFDPALVTQQMVEYKKGGTEGPIMSLKRLVGFMAHHVSVNSLRRELLMYEPRTSVGTDVSIDYGDILDIAGQVGEVEPVTVERGLDTTRYLVTPEASGPYLKGPFYPTNKLFAVIQVMDPKVAREKGLVEALVKLGLPESVWEGTQPPVEITSI